MKPEDKRWEQVRHWELEYDRSRLRQLSPEGKIGIYEEMRKAVRSLCPEKLGLKKLTLDDAYRDPHLADLLALRASLLKVYGRKPDDH